MNTRSKGTLQLTIAALCAVLAMVLLSPSPAYATTETVLQNFAGGTTDGEFPYGGLVMDSSGNLYGGTANGGTHNQGVVFKITSGGTYSVIWNFGGTGDGQEVYSSLILDSSGNLYGTTEYGGAHGSGIVFELSLSGGTWSETILYSFGAVTHDGQNPFGPVVMDGSGNLYGTTTAGGTGNLGTIFKLSLSGGTWSETKLHDFAGGSSDGNLPYAGVLISGTTLYGVTYNGGANTSRGTLYSIKTDGTSFTFLHSFGGTGDGSNPKGGLVMDGSGNLYGTTVSGGSNASGTAFEYSSLGSYSKIWDFGAGTDAYNPVGAMVLDGSGHLFGTATAGGAHSADGALFKLTPPGTNWTESVVYSFKGFSDPSKDGQNPECDLIMDGSGNVYGTTKGGGTNNLGIVFKVTP